MKCKFCILICILIFASFGLVACEKETNSTSIKGSDYNKVMNQGLEAGGISKESILSEEAVGENKMIIYTTNNAVGVASMIKSKDGWRWNRSTPLYDFKDVSKTVAYTVGDVDIKISEGKEYHLAVGRIYNASIKKITLANDEITTMIVKNNGDIFWFKLLDNKDLNRDVKAYDTEGKLVNN